MSEPGSSKKASDIAKPVPAGMIHNPYLAGICKSAPFARRASPATSGSMSVARCPSHALLRTLPFARVPSPLTFTCFPSSPFSSTVPSENILLPGKDLLRRLLGGCGGSWGFCGWSGADGRVANGWRSSAGWAGVMAVECRGDGAALWCQAGRPRESHVLRNDSCDGNAEPTFGASKAGRPDCFRATAYTNLCAQSSWITNRLYFRAGRAQRSNLVSIWLGSQDEIQNQLASKFLIPGTDHLPR